MVFKIIGLVFCALGMISAIRSHGKPFEENHNGFLEGAQMILLALVLILI